MATNKIIGGKSYVSESDARVAANSTAVSTGDFVILSGGFVTSASGATKIEGLSNQTTTFASDNQTVAKAKLSYTLPASNALYRVEISGGTVTAADEGKFYALTDANTVDGTTESAVAFIVNTTDTSATDPVTRVANLQLKKYISATLGDFAIVD